MCTVTIIPHADGIRLAANRDESRQRPHALAPRVVVIGERRALMPIDPQSGGTWIAASDAGLVMTLLNANPKPYASPAQLPKRSRGAIIPELLRSATLVEACERAQALAAPDFATFRLVIADRSECVELYAEGQTVTQKPVTCLERPLMFTSSGLGDALVDAPRRALFDEWFSTATDWASMQDAYHRHSWPDRPHLSVCMSRPEARTVSLTIVEIGALSLTITYHPEAPNQPAEPTTTTLPLAPRAC